jgi:pyruvate/2-oxoglutarate dehydrogenase complex dihydrolipoamide acyltransferase (E2) component
MPQVPIIMPQLGESIAEATIVDIKVKPGDDVIADQEIIDVETQKAVMGVTTPCKGKIASITAQLKETYPIGSVLGYVEASEADAARFAKLAPAPPQKQVAEEIPTRADEEVQEARPHFAIDGDGYKTYAPSSGGSDGGGLPVPAKLKGASFVSPRVRARMAELQLTPADLAGIIPSGAGNRVTIKDLENFLRKIDSEKAKEASAIRTGVADAMRRSWTRPLSTVGSSLNLDPVLEDRKSRDPKPGPGLYATRALALALAENPTSAAKLIGNRVVQSNSIDVGVAVEAEDGIMVPVIRGADKVSLVDLVAKYQELVDLARKRRISPDMQAGGIATVSNFGTFGIEWGTPIPLPDQTLLLGLGAGKKSPVWDDSKSEFIPKTEAQIILSFDHRSMDGGGAARLLKRVIELLEDPKSL